MRSRVRRLIKSLVNAAHGQPNMPGNTGVAVPVPFSSSGDYWNERYKTGGHSGSGSYNRLARFKADYLNKAVRRLRIGSVIEFGSGDGSQLTIARYPSYIGVDISPTAVAQTRSLFARDAGKSFYTVDELPAGTTADLALSLDVIFHLVEDAVFEQYMATLFAAARRYVIVYASNDDLPQHVPHVRHRKFTDWVARERPDFELIERVANKYPYDPENKHETSSADFYLFARR